MSATPVGLEPAAYRLEVNHATPHAEGPSAMLKFFETHTVLMAWSRLSCITKSYSLRNVTDGATLRGLCFRKHY